MLLIDSHYRDVKASSNGLWHELPVLVLHTLIERRGTVVLLAYTQDERALAVSIAVGGAWLMGLLGVEVACQCYRTLRSRA